MKRRLAAVTNNDWLNKPIQIMKTKGTTLIQRAALLVLLSTFTTFYVAQISTALAFQGRVRLPSAFGRWDKS